MENTLKSNEQEFFTWLQNNVDLDYYEEIRSSYRSVCAILIKKKILKQPLVCTTQIGKIESLLKQTRKIFVGKKLCAKAESILTLYIDFLEKKENLVSSKGDDSSEVLKTSGNGIPIEISEPFLQGKGLEGATVQQIINNVQPNAAFYPTNRSLEESLKVIAMPEKRYVDSDAFVDLDEAEEKMERILNIHFVQFGGYSNSKLLYGAASQDLSMFLNDNDCDDLDSVYCLAEYFFDKKRTNDKYIFSYPHIFETKPNYPLNLKGLMINLARKNGGILNVDEAKNYLQKTLLSYGNLNQLLKMSTTNTFLRYDKERYLLSEILSIDENWEKNLHDKLDDLFCQADVAYVIPRDISNVWLNSLPILPQNLSWTILLLQEVLRNFPDIGYRPIMTDLEQNMDTISAAFVPKGSQLQSFPDIVSLFMNERHSLPMRMTCEELRVELRDAGMLEGSELIYALPKALKDSRFSWTDENRKVLVRKN